MKIRIFLCLFIFSFIALAATNYPVPAPSTSGNVMSSNGYKWTSSGTIATSAIPTNIPAGSISSGTLALARIGQIGTAQIVPGSNSQVLKTSSGTVAWGAGGSGSGSKNYLGNINGTDNGGDFETNSVGSWTLGTLNVSAGGFPSGTPSFGSGASANLSVAISTSNGTLSGSYSLQEVSSAATTLGNMLASPAFTIDSSDQAKNLTFSFSYKAAVNPTNGNFSGTSSNSFAIAIYDVTNTSWIMPAGSWCETQSSGVGKCVGSFQTSSSGVGYRFIIYNMNASSGAITMLYDDFSLGPSSITIGPAMSDWEDTTVTSSGWGTGSATILAKRRRVGDSREYQVSITKDGSAGTGTSSVLFTIQDTIDSTKLPTATIDKTLFGVAYYAGAAGYTATDAVALGTTYTNVLAWKAGAGFEWRGQDFGANSKMTLQFKVPISGLSSNVQMSNDTDTRVVAARIYASTTSIPNTGVLTLIQMSTVSHDTHGATSTGASTRFTAPVTGYYRVAAMAEWGAAVSGGLSSLEIYKNGSSVSQIFIRTGAYTQYDTMQGADTIQMNAGDYVNIYARQGGSGSVSLAGAQMAVERVSGPSVVASADTVAAHYTFTGTATGVPNNSNTTISTTYATYTKTSDTHSAFSSGVYTFPISGLYQVTACSTSQPNATGLRSTLLQQAGSSGALMTANYMPNGSNTLPQPVTGLFRALAGDTVSIQNYQSSGGTLGVSPNAYQNWFSVIRVGNY